MGIGDKGLSAPYILPIVWSENYPMGIGDKLYRYHPTDNFRFVGELPIGEWRLHYQERGLFAKNAGSENHPMGIGDKLYRYHPTDNFRFVGELPIGEWRLPRWLLRFQRSESR